MKFIDKIIKNEKVKYWVLIFLLGAFIGWVYEEIFYLVEEKAITNRGFLYGCYLPVYGWGSILLVLFLKKLRKHPALVFLLAMLITGILEYITGYAMDVIWHKQWWTYEGLFLNINGYVCLRSVLTFGIGAILLIYLVDPIINKFIKNKEKLSTIVVTIFLIIYLIDNIITFTIRY